MKKLSNTYLLILFLCVMVGLSGYNYFFHPFKFDQAPVLELDSQQPSPSPALATQPEVLESPESILAQLPPERRVALLMMVPVVISQPAETVSQQVAGDWAEFLTQYQPGAALIFGRDISTDAARAAIGQLHTASDVLIAVDHEGGAATRLNGDGFAKLASWRKTCALEDTARIQLLEQTAAQLRNVGVDMVLGPVLDVGSAGSALGERTCSTDASTVAIRGQEYARIFKAAGVMTVFKHFPGIGSLKQDLHTTAVTQNSSPLESFVFKSVLDTFPKSGVMISHLSVLELGDARPCSLSATCINSLTEKYPGAFVVSDSLDMESALHMVTAASGSGQSKRTLSKAAVEAVEAGQMVLTFGAGIKPAQLAEVHRALVAEYQSSISFSRQVDAQALRILELKLQLKGK